jgi:hypothetical protein
MAKKRFMDTQFVVVCDSQKNIGQILFWHNWCQGLWWSQSVDKATVMPLRKADDLRRKLKWDNPKIMSLREAKEISKRQNAQDRSGYTLFDQPDLLEMLDTRRQLNHIIIETALPRNITEACQQRLEGRGWQDDEFGSKDW